ncbi:MAG: hypothetical protein ACE5F9_10115 [Phycisphaerae bacterium]
MGEHRSSERAGPAGALDGVDARAGSRRVFRKMIKAEAEDRPLSFLRRRELIRFASRIEIDPFEARLMIRAVEYECGHTPPAAMADIGTAADLAYVAEPEPWPAWLNFLLGVLLALGAAGVGLWLASR